MPLAVTVSWGFKGVVIIRGKHSSPREGRRRVATSKASPRAELVDNVNQVSVPSGGATDVKFRCPSGAGKRFVGAVYHGLRFAPLVATPRGPCRGQDAEPRFWTPSELQAHRPFPEDPAAQRRQRLRADQHPLAGGGHRV